MGPVREKRLCMSTAQAQFNLSPAQQQVVDHRGADVQVIACAGSGKTESVSRRVTALIAEGTEPSSIVAFTFTERAASELKERITRRVAERMGLGFRDRLGPMFVGCCQVNEFGALCGRVDQRSGCCHRGPHCESSGSQQSMMDRPQPMTSHSKQILNNSVSMQEMLSVVG